MKNANLKLFGCSVKYINKENPYEFLMIHSVFLFGKVLKILAWACTVHKVQGKQFYRHGDKTDISIHPNKVNFELNLINKALNRSQSQNRRLALVLSIKVGARVMITSNIDVADRLSNGQIGTVKHVKLEGNQINCVYVKMDDKCAGLKLMK